MSTSTEQDMTNLGYLSRAYLDGQAQYGNRYAVTGTACPYLAGPEHGDGRTLHVVGTMANYHAMTIATADAGEYVTRVLEFKLDEGVISAESFEATMGRVLEDLCA